MTGPLISFIVPVRNDAARLQRCLSSIADSTGAIPVELVVADNGSVDDSSVVAQAAGAQVLALPALRVSQLRNIAVSTARADLIAFIDADHIVAPDWTRAALAVMQDPSVWAAGAEYHSPADATWVQCIYDGLRTHPPGVVAVDWLPSGNLIVRRSAFERVRGFDEQLESCEDVDFCRRIRGAGGRLVSAEALRSIHCGDPATLSALFFSELWRGRDNLRASFRERLTLRSAPSVVVPLLDLGCLFVVGIGMLTRPVLIPIALMLFGLLASVRATRIYSRLPAAGRGPVAAIQAWLVATTYDLARALALVTRAGHGVRRRGKP